MYVRSHLEGISRKRPNCGFYVAAHRKLASDTELLYTGGMVAAVSGSKFVGFLEIECDADTLNQWFMLCTVHLHYIHITLFFNKVNETFFHAEF